MSEKQASYRAPKKLSTKDKLEGLEKERLKLMKERKNLWEELTEINKKANELKNQIRKKGGG